MSLRDSLLLRAEWQIWVYEWVINCNNVWNADTLRNRFTDPYIVDEANFNITNKINFVKDGAGYEIEYNVSPKGVGIFQNLGAKAEKKILPDPSIKKTPAPKPAREFFPRFENVGKQNLKV